MRLRRLTSRLFLLIGVLALTGCDASQEGTGFFQATARGALNVQLEGQAQYALITGNDETPSAFEITLFDGGAEIVIRSVDGSGPPEAATYDVERAPTGASTQVVTVEFIPDRFSATAERFVGQSGFVTIERVANGVVEGRFEIETTGTNNPGAQVTLFGQFTAPRI